MKLLSELPEPARNWAAGKGVFADWVNRYLSEADSMQRLKLEEEGVALAEARRAEFKQLIETNPRAAIETAVPMVIRQALPDDVVSRLERRVHAVADVEVLAVSQDSAPQEPTVRWFTRIGDEELRTYVYGRREEHNSLRQVPVNGVAVDRAFALNESPLRVLEIGEIPPAGFETVQTCPVSGKTTPLEGTGEPISEETPAVQVGAKVVYLCDGGHIRAYEEELIAAEGGTGGATTLSAPAATGFNNGPRTLLYMRVVFPDDLQEPQTEAAAWEAIRQMNDYFAEISYGKVFYLAAVTPVMVLPRSEAWYAADYTANGSATPIMTDAKEAARAAGYNPDNFQHYTVIYTGGPGTFGGLGSVGGSNVWLRTTSLGTFAHEIGHNVGLWHANYWNTSNRDVIGGGSNGEYGHSYDVMGSSSSIAANKGHFNAHHKNLMNWMPNEEVSAPVVSGTYRIFAMDQTVLDPEKRYGLRVTKDGGRDYWVDFRQKYNADHRWFRDGVLLQWSRWGQNLDVSVVGSNRGAHLLDTTPGSADGKNDAPIVMGRTFSDLESGVHITPLGKGGTTPESMDVQVHLGDFPGNSAPVINNLTASTSTPAVNGTVNFSVDATDADGDPLAYFWDFGDATYGTNAAAVSKQFTSARHHAVRCIVSDMKGGETSKLILITVGTPSTFTASGRVLDGLGNPMREVRIENGSSGASFRGAWTDSNGDFVVTNLSSGSVTLTPVISNWTFAPANYSISVGPSATALDFTASEGVRVSIEAVDADATEAAGNDGQFRITRTGDISAALAVYVDLQGDAVLTTDYTLSPAADTTTVSPIEIFTIPANESFLDINLTGVVDTTREGPEPMRMVLIPHASYAIAGKSAAEVIITDTGTNSSANRVSIVALDADAHETGDGGLFEIRRSGPTTSALNVTLTIDGAPNTTAATNGSDYQTIPASISIPAGEASVQLAVNPTQDSLVEGQETVRVTIASSSSYGVGIPSNAIVRIADDETPVLTLFASDPNAAEAGNDTGAFTVIRSGDLSAPLEVPYILGGSALHGTDYLALPGSVTIPAGEASADILIVPVDDTLGEPFQTVVLQLRNDPRYLLPDFSSATVTIADNDLPVVAVSVTDGTCNEPSATGQFRLTTTGSGSGNITVRYAISGTATSGSDFIALAGTASMGRNTTSSITVTPLNDSLLEDAESVVLTILPDPAYQVDVLQPSATMMIRDDDHPATVNVSFSSLTMAENAGTSNLFISRTTNTGGANTSGNLTVNYSVSGTATNGSDYSTLSGSATIPSGASSVSVPVTGINDSIAEGTETLTVTLGTGSYSRESMTATLLITDDETSGFARTASFASRQTVVVEGEAPIGIPVVLSSPNASAPVTVDYIIDTNSATGSGVDHAVAAGRLTFAPGVTQMSIPISITDDLLPELEEHLTLKLSHANGAQLTGEGSFHTVFIRDNEPRVSLTASQPVAYEQNGAAGVFTLTRSGPVSASLTVNLAFAGTAGSGSDYTAISPSVTFPAGIRTVARQVTPLADAFVEGAETVVATLLPGSRYLVGGTGTAIVTIQDSGANKAPSVQISQPSQPEVSLASDNGLVLAATASDDAPVSGLSALWTRQSGPGSVTFDSTTTLATGAKFSLPGRYVLRCTVTDGGSLASFAEVAVVVQSTTEDWTPQNIGISAGSAGGAADVRSRWVQNQGAGSSITGTSDSFHFTHTGMTGDGEIVARYEGTDGQFSSARAGLMLRENATATARYAGIVFSGVTGSLVFNRRTSVSGTVSVTTVTLPPGPRWLRLSRSGNNFSAWHSLDGAAWVQVGTTQSITMTSSVLAGIATTSGSAARPARGLFSDVRVSGLPGNRAPWVDAAAGAPAGSWNQLPLSATVTDDSQPEELPDIAFLWTKISGPGAVVFADDQSAATTATFSAPGSYVLRLSADDSEAAGFDEVAVNVVQPVIAFGALVHAAEEGLVPGSIALSRSGPNSQPLVVSYTVGGTATAGSDYATLSGTATFDAGAANTSVVVTPFSDNLAEGDETISITLQPSADYQIPASPTAAITLKDTAAGSWLFGQFGAQANDPQIAGWMEDPDMDGLNNLQEMAYGTAATAANPDPLMQDMAEVGGNRYLRLHVPKNPALPGLIYEVQATSDLGNPATWSGSGLVIEENSATMLRVRDSTPAAPGIARFMRSQVSLP